MKKHLNKLRLVLISFIAIVSFAACTPAELAAWHAAHASSSTPAQTWPSNEHDILWHAIHTKFPSSQHRTAIRVATCESGTTSDFKSIDMRAVSHTNDHGAFQINATTWNKPYHSDPVARFIGQNWHRRYEPAMNAEMAYRIWARYGWRMWSCY